MSLRSSVWVIVAAAVGGAAAIAKIPTPPSPPSALSLSGKTNSHVCVG